MPKIADCRPHFKIVFFIYIYNDFFPLLLVYSVQHGDPVTHTYIHTFFFLKIVFFICKYIAPDLCS